MAVKRFKAMVGSGVVVVDVRRNEQVCRVLGSNGDVEVRAEAIAAVLNERADLYDSLVEPERDR